MNVWRDICFLVFLQGVMLSPLTGSQEDPLVSNLLKHKGKVKIDEVPKEWMDYMEESGKYLNAIKEGMPQELTDVLHEASRSAFFLGAELSFMHPDLPCAIAPLFQDAFLEGVLGTKKGEEFFLNFLKQKQKVTMALDQSKGWGCEELLTVLRGRWEEREKFLASDAVQWVFTKQEDGANDRI